MSDDSDFEKCTFQENISLRAETDSHSFDVSAGQTWIYPINYPIRDYQFNIIQKALFQNTLVSLPTGLGKTFIAAVVMYNFYRWYPTGKILFLAPTRPLVRQQMDACYNITAIPEEVTAELTGTKEKKSRADIWRTKRVFFITPQVLQNDLETVEDLGSSVRCIVFDEAHKTRGNHAYSEVMRKLMQQNNSFRVLALSATPGKDIRDMKEVIQNLLISHLEFRTEESSDVQPYVYQRTLETVVVPLDNRMQHIKSAYLEILEHYTRTLIKYKIIQGNCSTLTKGKIFMVLKEFQAKNTGNRHSNYSEIMKNLNVCVTLYHAYELLIRHGLRSFVLFFEDHLDKPLLRGNIALRQVVEDTKAFLGPLVISEALPDGTHTNVPEDTRFGHPKFYKLQEILIQHFTKIKEASRVIVFFEYRESVKEAYALLLRNHPLIKPRIFLGQGSGVTQRLQLSVVQAFKEGTCNTLLSTSIGEEGLDVGEVDLIVCFDISNKSPIRMIQRMGRTGRKREGHVIILVTQGKEQQTLEECLRQKKYLGTEISSSPALKSVLYTCSPRMVPDDITPQCEKVYFTVKKKPTAKKNLTIKDMFRDKYAPNLDDINEVEELQPIVERLPPVCNYWNMSDPLSVEEDTKKIKFSKKIDKLRKLQSFSEIGHSKDSEMLVSLLQIADCKRFNIPITQHDLPQKKNLRQGDIRTIFKQSLEIDKDLKASQNLSNMTIFHTQNIQGDSIADETFNEIFNYLCIKESTQSACGMCVNLFKCPDIPDVSKKLDLDDWLPPNLSALYSITKETFGNLKMSTASTSNLNKVSSLEDDFQSYCNDNNFSFWDNLTSKIVESEEKQKYNGTKAVVNINGKSEISVDSFNEEHLLTFFKLDSLAEVFTVEPIKSKTNTPSKNNTLILIDSSPESPTLSKFETVSHIKSKLVCKNLGETKFKSFPVSKELSVSSPHKHTSLPNVVKSIKEIEEEKPSKIQKECNDLVKNEINNLLDVEDVFDISFFTEDLKNKCADNLKNQNDFELKANDYKLEVNRSHKIPCQGKKNEHQAEKLPLPKEHIDLEESFFTEDICDLSFFGLSNNDTRKRKNENEVEITSKRIKLNTLSETVNTSVMQEKNKHKYVFHKTSPEKTERILAHNKHVIDTEDICDLSIFGLSGEDKVGDNIRGKGREIDISNSDKIKLNKLQPLEDFKKPCIPLKNRSEPNVSSVEQTQLGITQIIDLISNAEELIEDSDKVKINKAASKGEDYFDDFLNKLN